MDASIITSLLPVDKLWTWVLSFRSPVKTRIICRPAAKASQLKQFGQAYHNAADLTTWDLLVYITNMSDNKIYIKYVSLEYHTHRHAQIRALPEIHTKQISAEIEAGEEKCFGINGENYDNILILPPNDVSISILTTKMKNPLKISGQKFNTQR